jgi:hypothetical protein
MGSMLRKRHQVILLEQSKDLSIVQLTIIARAHSSQCGRLMIDRSEAGSGEARDQELGFLHIALAIASMSVSGCHAKNPEHAPRAEQPSQASANFRFQSEIEGSAK